MVSTRADINLSNLTSKGNERLLNGSEPHIFEAQKGFKTENVLDDPFGYQELYDNKYSLFKKDDFSIIGTPVDGSEETLTDDGVVTIKSPNVFGSERITTGQPDLSTANSFYWKSPLYYYGDDVTSFSLVEYLPGNTLSASNTGFSVTLTTGYLQINGRKKTDSGFENIRVASNVTTDDLRGRKFQIVLKWHEDLLEGFLSVEQGTWEFFAQADCSGLDKPAENNTRSFFVLGGDAYGTAKCTGMQMDLKYTRLYIDGNLVISGSPHNIDTIKPDNYEVVGDHKISEDGLVNNLRRTKSAVKIPVPLDFSKNTIIQGTFKTSDNIGGFAFGLGNTQYALGTNIRGEVGQQLVWYNSTGSVFIPDNSLQPNTVYNFELTPTTITVGEFSLNINLEGVSVDFLLIGNSIKENYTKGFDGSIDLNSVKIYVDGNLVYQPCLKIPYTLSKTGSKIVPAYARNRVEDLYEQTGEALYWIIDEENQNYTLPKGEVYGMIDNSRKSNLPVGMIFTHTCSASYIPENSLPCDGAEYTRDQFPRFYDGWLTTANLNTCTFDEFETEVSTTGECWKFGLDTTTQSFKVPKILDKVVSTGKNTLNAYGNGKTMGLTDGTIIVPVSNGSISGVPGFIVARGVYDNFSEVGTSSPSTTPAPVNGYTMGLSTDPTKSGIVVDLPTQTIKHFVVVATGSINQSEMDWSAWASGLQGKLNTDHSNDTKPYIKTTMDDGNGNGYIIYSNGYAVQYGVMINTYAGSNTGALNVAFYKEFIDTNYFFTRSPRWQALTTTPSFDEYTSGDFNRTTTGTSVGTHSDIYVAFICWEAKGYLKEGEY